MHRVNTMFACRMRVGDLPESMRVGDLPESMRVGDLPENSSPDSQILRKGQM